uniref:Uncharacterized protein n=1 Tax=Arundo donax TaxID=35708 RepID=A0A0A9EAR1_ARUDO
MILHLPSRVILSVVQHALCCRLTQLYHTSGPATLLIGPSKAAFPTRWSPPCRTRRRNPRASAAAERREPRPQPGPRRRSSQQCRARPDPTARPPAPAPPPVRRGLVPPHCRRVASRRGAR